MDGSDIALLIVATTSVIGAVAVIFKRIKNCRSICCNCEQFESSSNQNNMTEMTNIINRSADILSRFMPDKSALAEGSSNIIDPKKSAETPIKPVQLDDDLSQKSPESMPIEEVP